MQEMVNERSLQDSVSFVDHAENVADLYRAADVLCLPSRAEGMANVILEAMASGLPFVATPASGMAELASSGGGLLAEPAAEPIARALEESILRGGELGARGRQAAEARYSNQAVLQQYITLFTSLV